MLRADGAARHRMIVYVVAVLLLVALFIINPRRRQ